MDGGARVILLVSFQDIVAVVPGRCGRRGVQSGLGVRRDEVGRRHSGGGGLAAEREGAGL